MLKKTPPASLEEARRSGLPVLWPVFENYLINPSTEGAILVPILGKKAESWYTPSTRPELPGELAKLKRGDEAGLLRFAETYGLLGYSDLRVEAAQPVSDPVGWIWHHAETVDLTLSLKDALDQDADDELGRILSRQTHPRFKGSCVVKAAYQSQVEIRPFSSAGGRRNLAAYILRTIVNKNIVGIHPEIGWDERRGTFVPYNSFNALIQVVYWHVSNALIGGRVARCNTCGGRFIQTDRRQRFCPTGTEQESPCAVRARVREWREEQLKKKQANLRERKTTPIQRQSKGARHGKKNS